MRYKFNWVEGRESLNKKDSDKSITKQELASFITTIGVTNTIDLETVDNLIETGLDNCEMKLTVNGVELNIERILDRLIEIIEKERENKYENY